MTTSNLNIDQRSVLNLFKGLKNKFIIPDYQRPYAWDELECQTLWDDIRSFAFPNDNHEEFNPDDEYFLGPIVTFKNEDGNLEVIDGQQRITTLMLLLRAFYESFGNMRDDKSLRSKEMVVTCIWKTDEFGNPDKNRLKIDSFVATDEDKKEFKHIMDTGTAPSTMKSHYASNYRFFMEKIDRFLHDYPSYFAYLPTRLMNNCILLPIEAESQDTALRIFSTLNNRGKSLSDADIFKAQFYKHFSEKTDGGSRKDYFIREWKNLEEVCDNIFDSSSDSAMDELFTRYMYYERALQRNKSSTTEALRKFYEKNNYALLKTDRTFTNLMDLAQFWKDVYSQSIDKFSERVLRKLLILNMAPNSMWTYITSVYFMHNKDENGRLDEGPFYDFLDTIIPFIWVYAVINPGVNALRTPIYAEMVNIIEDRPVDFKEYLFEESHVRNQMLNYKFTNQRPITKSMLAWWAFREENQPVVSGDTKFEIEHIYAKNRQEVEGKLSNPSCVEYLGNKSLLEKSINIRASDYKFQDKKKYYEGFVTSSGKRKEGTRIAELLALSSKDDFGESDIVSRNDAIIDGLIEYLRRCNLLI